MDYRSLTSLALRVAGVLVIVNTVSDLPKLTLDTLSVARSTAYVSGFAMGPYVAVIGASVLASLLVGLALILFPGSIAKWTVGADEPADRNEPVFQRIQALTITGIGFYLLAAGLLSFLSRGIDVYFQYRYFVAEFHGGDWSIGVDNASRLAGHALFAAGGLAIVLGARGLSRLINRVRGYSWDDA